MCQQPSCFGRLRIFDLGCALIKYSDNFHMKSLFINWGHHPCMCILMIVEHGQKYYTLKLNPTFQFNCLSLYAPLKKSKCSARWFKFLTPNLLGVVFWGHLSHWGCCYRPSKVKNGMAASRHIVHLTKMFIKSKSVF